MVRSTTRFFATMTTLVALSGGTRGAAATTATTTIGFASAGRRLGGARSHPHPHPSSSFPPAIVVVCPPSAGDADDAGRTKPTDASGTTESSERGRNNGGRSRPLATTHRSSVSAPPPRRRWWTPRHRRTGAHVALRAVISIALVFVAAASSVARAASFATPAAAVPVGPSEAELCFRLLYAACCGAFVGLKRPPSSSSNSSSSSGGSDRRRRRPAAAIGGVRTMALVGLGAAAYTACSIHGFVPHVALGCEVGSPILASVKVDISRMASNVASGVGFIGAGCIHKARPRGGGGGGDGTCDDRNDAAAGLATAAAVWVSAAAGVASGAGATFATVAILGYAPRGPEDGGGDVVVDGERRRRKRTRTALVEAGGDRLLLDDGGGGGVGRSRPRRKERALERRSRGRDEGSVASGLFGKRGDMGYDYNAENDASYVDQYALYDRYSRDIHPIIIKEIIDPRFERYLGLVSRLGDDDADGTAAADDRRGGRPTESPSNVLIEEEQAVISARDVAESGQDTFEVES